MYYYDKRNQDLPTQYVEGSTYTNAEKGSIADALLRADSKSELCRECGEPGVKTGSVQHTAQPMKDGEGHQLVLDFAELECEKGHHWFQGEGAVKGIGGDNPILFEEHFQSRRRREIYTTQGTPDPHIVQGIYNRVHPQGRKVNSAEQRARNGASFYR